MSEAELHILKERMHQGRLNKARRGELFGPPPIGYIALPSGEPTIDPDEQVQAVVRLIFDQFDRQGTVHGLLRYLVHHRIQIPVRPPYGPNRGRLEWRRPSRGTLLNLLHHPIYAGAYRHGYRPTDPRHQQPGRPGTGRRVRCAEECLVLIRDKLPAYISWERFQANQQRLADNRARHYAMGAPRAGAALLGGLLYCERCGRRMAVHYAGQKSVSWYGCGRGAADYAEPLCQSLSSQVLDDLVASQILAAVEPAALEASLAAVAEVERERAALLQHWQLRLERAVYETERAARQYQVCEPENRLVGRELERRWEEALKQQRQLEEEFRRWQQSAVARLTAADQQAIRALASDLPAVWQAGTTAPADRKRITRLLLERVTVMVDKDSDNVDVRLHWSGGLTSTHQLVRPVSRYDQQTNYPRLVQRLREMSAQRYSSSAIAAKLNAEGFRPPKRTQQFTAAMVQRLTLCLGLSRRQPHGSREGLGRHEYRPTELARRLGVSRDLVRRWLRVGWLNVRRDEDGHHIIWADADELRRLRALYRLPRTWANKARLAELKKPKQRPAQ
jgi:DNA invertase Pin-like site-specific DNA recombinase